MTMQLPVGSVVGGFTVQASVGEGATGRVYLASSPDHPRVALKVLAPELADDERFRQRFLRESRLAAALDDPNVVPVLAAGEEEGQLYLAMRYVEGSDLREVLLRDGRLEPERALDLAAQVASALDAAHAAGLVHRDVKPANILVEDDRAYVCDFGLARHVSSVSSLTTDRGFVGTIDYISPEQIEGGSIDGRTDVYSLGCVLFECLAGRRPFDRESDLATVFAHLNEPPPRLSELRPDLPAEFDEVFATALAKSPGDRYASCGELVAAARAALEGRTFVRSRRRRTRALAAATAAAIAAAAIVAVLVVPGSAKRPPITIGAASIGGVKLGDSVTKLQSILGAGSKVSLQTPPDYQQLTFGARQMSAIYIGDADRAAQVITWNRNDRTAAGVGPCSTLAQLQAAYGNRLKPVAASANNPDHVVWAYHVGKHVMFALGSPPKPTFVGSVSLYSNPAKWPVYLALGGGPCGHAPVTTGNIKPANLDCSNPSGGPCSGTVAGRHTTAIFEPKLTYTQPVGWNNYLASAHDLEFTPPGSNWTKDRYDEVAVFPGIATARGQCASGPSSIRTPAAFARWILRHPGVDATRPKPVDVGGLRGYVLDIRMRKTWRRTCPWSHGRPAVLLIEGIPPRLGVEYGVEPSPFAMRLYLLAWNGGTLGIDLIAQHGAAKLGSYSAFVKSFRFAGR